MYSRSYIPVCGPNDLTRQQVEQLMASVRFGPEIDPDENWLGEYRLWVPLIVCFLGDNEVYRGTSLMDARPPATGPDVYDTWLEAEEFLGVGPLALPYARQATAHFRRNGENFAYRRYHAILWGFLWMDRLEKKGVGSTAEYDRIDGLFFTAFGWGQRKSPDGTRSGIRFLWIPIWF